MQQAETAKFKWGRRKRSPGGWFLHRLVEGLTSSRGERTVLKSVIETNQTKMRQLLTLGKTNQKHVQERKHTHNTHWLNSGQYLHGHNKVSNSDLTTNWEDEGRKGSRVRECKNSNPCSLHNKLTNTEHLKRKNKNKQKTTRNSNVGLLFGKNGGKQKQRAQELKVVASR